MQKQIIWPCLMAALLAIPTVLFLRTGRVVYAQSAERTTAGLDPRVGDQFDLVTEKWTG